MIISINLKIFIYMEKENLQQLFRSDSDCYTQVWIRGEGWTEKLVMSEDRFVEVVTKILSSNEREIDRKHSKAKEVCSFSEKCKFYKQGNCDSDKCYAYYVVQTG